MMDNNSVKRFKQPKDCENSLEKNEQEVLVLPPNLLQELGINLGNIQNTSYYPVVKGKTFYNNFLLFTIPVLYSCKIAYLVFV